MHGRRAFALVVLGVLAVGLVGVAAITVLPADLLAANDQVGADGPSVTFYDGDAHVTTVAVEISDTAEERYVGLSQHDSLAENRGMLFVYERPDDHTYVMRSMDFGIDIVFVDADGCVREVHAAPEPGPDQNGENQRYPGYGQYVVEVPIGVVSDAGVEAGDPVRIEYDDQVIDGRGDCFDS